jgi:heparan-alpha-glucosaminide N-acetyltransferase
MYNTLMNERIRSVDAFRGITILVMVFVNDVAGVSGIPQWMKHMPADADAMTFVDMVFPAFLFIVGMSMPFAINNRMAKGDSFWKLQWHILWRTLGLLVLGIFMVNGEGGYNQKAMIIPIALWSLLFYASAILVWNVYRFKNKNLAYVLRGLGIAGLILLSWLYRGGENGELGMQPKWWGILGLIGWAYFFTAVIYQLMRGKILLLIVAIVLCLSWYLISRADFAKGVPALQWMASRAGHAAHTGIVLSGVVLSLLFFDQKINLRIGQRFMWGAVFAIAAAVAAFLIRPYYPISKIYATPTWCLYCIAACSVLYMILYWLTDVLKYDRWTAFFKPAASNALLVYILPAIILYLQILFGLHFTPAAFHAGLTGIIWSLCFALFIMLLAMGLNRLKIRLQL